MSIIKDNRYHVESKFIKTDVTALEVVFNHILAGKNVEQFNVKFTKMLQ